MDIGFSGNRINFLISYSYNIPRKINPGSVCLASPFESRRLHWNLATEISNAVSRSSILSSGNATSVDSLQFANAAASSDVASLSHNVENEIRIATG